MAVICGGRLSTTQQVAHLDVQCSRDAVQAGDRGGMSLALLQLADEVGGHAGGHRQVVLRHQRVVAEEPDALTDSRHRAPLTSPRSPHRCPGSYPGAYASVGVRTPGYRRFTQQCGWQPCGR